MDKTKRGLVFVLLVAMSAMLMGADGDCDINRSNDCLIFCS